MVGVEKAYEFLARFNIPTDKLDIEAVYQSFIKYFLAKGMNDSLMKKEAYNALIATLTNDFAKTKTHILPKGLTSLKQLLEQHDLNDLLHNNFSTTKFTDNEFNPYALLLQQKLNNGNATDKFGLSLKEDGIFGPNTQGANDGKKLELADITRTLARLLFGNPSNIDITKSGLYPEIF